MPYRHDFYPQYTRLTVFHSYEEMRHSGIIVPRPLAKTQIDIVSGPTPVGLLVDESDDSELDLLLRPADLSYETDHLPDGVTHILETIRGMGAVATLKFGLYNNKQTDMPSTIPEDHGLRDFAMALSKHFKDADDKASSNSGGTGLYM